MKSPVVGALLLGTAACGGSGAGAAPAAPAAPAAAEREGLSSRELAMVLFKGGRALADVTFGELRPAGPFMPPPPPPVEPDYSGALKIELHISDPREGPARWGVGRDTTWSHVLVVHSMPAQRVQLGRWHYSMCTLLHSMSNMPESADTGVAQLLCIGNGAGVSFTLARRARGETVDIHVHEGSDGLGGPTYREGIVAQVRVPRGRAIHLLRTAAGEAEPLEERRYFPFE